MFEIGGDEVVREGVGDLRGELRAGAVEGDPHQPGFPHGQHPQACLQQTRHGSLPRLIAAGGSGLRGGFADGAHLDQFVQFLDQHEGILRRRGRGLRLSLILALDHPRAQSAGLSMGQMMAAGLGAGMVQGQNQAQPQPAAAPAEDPFVLIEKLHKLVEMGAISQEEFDTKKTALLAKIG